MKKKTKIICTGLGLTGLTTILVPSIISLSSCSNNSNNNQENSIDNSNNQENNYDSQKPNENKPNIQEININLKKLSHMFGFFSGETAETMKWVELQLKTESDKVIVNINYKTQKFFKIQLPRIIVEDAVNSTILIDPNFVIPTMGEVANGVDFNKCSQVVYSMDTPVDGWKMNYSSEPATLINLQPLIWDTIIPMKAEIFGKNNNIATFKFKFKFVISSQ